MSHQFDRGVLLIGLGVRGGGGDGPVQVAREAVLLDGARPELGEAQGHAARDRLLAVEHGVGANVQDLVYKILL
jgi:hypothetical protein